MSDFSEKDILETLPEGEDFHAADVVKASSSDFDPADVHSEHKEDAAPISKMDSALEGGRQGITAGFSDEGSGGVGAGMDAAQALLNKLGLASPSPTQVSEQLASQGVKGDVGPQSTLDMYRQFRDEDRTKMEAAQKANPGSFIGGALAGGLASTPLIPNSILSPLGNAAQGASLATRALTGAGNATRMGAIAGLGAGKSDLTQGDVPGAIMDTGAGMASGMALGGALPIAGAALSSAGDVAGGLVPDMVKTAYQRGKDGIKIGAQKFYDDTTNSLKNVVDDVSSAISGKVKAQQDAHTSQIGHLDNQISEIQDNAQKAMKLEESRQVAENAQDIHNLNNETVKTAKRLQEQVYNVKKELGKQFDQIDLDAEATGVVPNVKTAVDQFQDILMHSTMDEAKLNRIMKNFLPTRVVGKEASLDTFKHTKQMLTNLFEDDSPQIRRAAKQAYGALKSQYSSDLMDKGYTALANKIADTNKRWSAASELEDSFLSNLNPNRVTGEIEPSPDTIKAVSNYSDKNPTQMAQSDFMGKLLNKLDPQGAPGMVNEMEGLASQNAQLKAFKPNVPEQPNPELDRLQGLLDQTKSQSPEKIPGLDLNTGNEPALKNQLSGLLPKSGMNTGNDVAENQLKQTMDFLGKEKGPEFVNSLKDKLAPLTKDVQLRNMVHGSNDTEIPTSIQAAAGKVIGGSVKAANKVGEAVSATKNLLQRGVKTLSDANPEQLNVLAQRMTGTPEGVQYAKVLAEAAGKSRQSKNSIIFGLMQQPGFRELFHKANEGQDESK